MDKCTRKSFEYRESWFEVRILELGNIFACGIHAWAVMSNHLHIVVHMSPATAQWFLAVEWQSSVPAPLIQIVRQSECHIMSIYIPLFQTLVWPVFIAGIVFLFRGTFKTMLDAVAANLRKGASIVVGPAGVSIGTPPPEIRNTDQTVGVTSEGAQGAKTSQPIVEALEGKRPLSVVDSLYLVHASQVILPRSDQRAGLYRVRVSLESDPAENVSQVKRVTYQLHSTFSKRIIATEARDKNFELWLNVYGEFNIVAVLERDGKESIWLTRYLDLPGRPPE